jgi:hypothetical protein
MIMASRNRPPPPPLPGPHRITSLFPLRRYNTHQSRYNAEEVNIVATGTYGKEAGYLREEVASCLCKEVAGNLC